MPNWTWNRIACKKSIGDKILDKTETGYSLDFNKIIPMPESLRLVAGSMEDEAVVCYYLSQSKNEKRKIKDLLENSKLFFHGNYWNKYHHYLERYQNEKDSLKKCIESFDGERPDLFKKFDNIYELGKQYVDNIKNYGFAQWYDWCNEKWGTKWNVEDDVDVEYDEKNEEYVICFNTAWSPPYGIIEEYSKLCEYDEDFDWEYENEDYDGHHLLTKEGNYISDSIIDYDDEEDEENEVEEELELC